MVKSKQSNLARINRVMRFYMSRGICSERVVKIYRKIIRNKMLIE
jgi:hypothetical protein